MELKIVNLIKEGFSLKNNDKITDFKPVKLKYGYDELSEFIDAETMEIHYNKHYKGYINKLNELLKDKKINLKDSDTIENLMSRVNGLGKKIKNQAGGVYNHEFFWK